MRKQQLKEFLKRQLRKKERRRLSRKYFSRPGIIFNSSFQFRGPIDFYRSQKNFSSYKQIKSPQILSFVENTDDTLIFFETLKSMISERLAIFINLQNVRKISPDALLYILSILKNLQIRGVRIPIQANRPTSMKCRNFIEQSGFYNHTETKNKPEHTDINMFEIKTGDKANLTTIKEIKNFCINKLNIHKYSEKGKAIYANLVECTTNTNNHAYKKKTGRGDILLNHWWILTTYHKKAVHITFLDNGTGIPSTVKKKVISMQHANDDATLIHKALQGGVIKSATGKKHRNKGLPKMYDRVINGKLVDKMTILSDKGLLEIDKFATKQTKLNLEFKGTLLHWIVS